MNRVPLLCVVLALLAPVPSSAQTGAEKEALAVVHAMFEAMLNRDREALAGVFHADARLMTTGTDRTGNAMVRTSPIDGFVNQVSQSQSTLDERLWDEEVRVSGNLATVWTKYVLYVDGAFSHCGVDAFQLAMTDSGWRIIQVADTRQAEGCEIPDHVKPGG